MTARLANTSLRSDTDQLAPPVNSQTNAQIPNFPNTSATLYSLSCGLWILWPREFEPSNMCFIRGTKKSAWNEPCYDWPWSQPCSRCKSEIFWMATRYDWVKTKSSVNLVTICRTVDVLIIQHRCLKNDISDNIVSQPWPVTQPRSRAQARPG